MGVYNSSLLNITLAVYFEGRISPFLCRISRYEAASEVGHVT